MMQEGVPVSVPEKGNNSQRQCKVEHRKTSQGEEGHHFGEDAAVRTDRADFRNHPVEAEKADEQDERDHWHVLGFGYLRAEAFPRGTKA